MNYDTYKLEAPEVTENNVFEFFISNYDDTMLFDTVEDAEEHLDFLKEEYEYSPNMEIKFTIKHQ